MLIRFNEISIISTFIKLLLSDFYEPNFTFFNSGDQIIANRLYYWKKNVYRAKITTNVNTLAIDKFATQLIVNYDWNTNYLNFSKPFISDKEYYDSDTHEMLGRYLRSYRDYKDINLMYFYNCFSNRQAENLKTTVITKTDSTSNFYTTDSNYTIWKFPCVQGKTYSIQMDCPTNIELISNIEKENNISTIIYGEEIGYKKFNNLSFTIPKYYTVPTVADFTYIYLKVPKSCTSSIFIREIGSTDIYKVGNSEVNSSVKSFRQTGIFCNLTFRTSIPNSRIKIFNKAGIEISGWVAFEKEEAEEDQYIAEVIIDRINTSSTYYYSFNGNCTVVEGELIESSSGINIEKEQLPIKNSQYNSFYLYTSEENTYYFGEYGNNSPVGIIILSNGLTNPVSILAGTTYTAGTDAESSGIILPAVSTSNNNIKRNLSRDLYSDSSLGIINTEYNYAFPDRLLEFLFGYALTSNSTEAQIYNLQNKLTEVANIYKLQYVNIYGKWYNTITDLIHDVITTNKLNTSITDNSISNVINKDMESYYGLY